MECDACAKACASAGASAQALSEGAVNANLQTRIKTDFEEKSAGIHLIYISVIRVHLLIY